MNLNPQQRQEQFEQAVLNLISQQQAQAGHLAAMSLVLSKLLEVARLNLEVHGQVSKSVDEMNDWYLGQSVSDLEISSFRATTSSLLNALMAGAIADRAHDEGVH